jgi:hypothetical protein
MGVATMITKNDLKKQINALGIRIENGKIKKSEIRKFLSTAETYKWSSPDHNKEIFIEHNGLLGSVIPSNGMFEWNVDGKDGKNIDAGECSSLEEAKKIVESILKEHEGQCKCRSCGRMTDLSGLCDRCYKTEAKATNQKSGRNVDIKAEGANDTTLPHDQAKELFIMIGGLSRIAKELKKDDSNKDVLIRHLEDIVHKLDVWAEKMV